MITNSKVLVGAVILTASLLFAATFYQTRNAFSSSRSQENHSHDLPTLDYENEVTKAKSKDRKEKGNHFKGCDNTDTRKPID